MVKKKNPSRRLDMVAQCARRRKTFVCLDGVDFTAMVSVCLILVVLLYEKSF